MGMGVIWNAMRRVQIVTQKQVPFILHLNSLLGVCLSCPSGRSGFLCEQSCPEGTWGPSEPKFYICISRFRLRKRV